MKGITIMKSRVSHYQRIADIYNEYILKHGATMVEKIHDANDILEWTRQHNAREGLFSLLLDGELIGWGVIKRYSDRYGYRFSGETSVFLTAAYVGQGYGSYFKKFLIQRAVELGYRHLVAKIFRSNELSINYNLKLGYELVGIQQQVGYKQGQWVDVTILQLLLDHGGS